MKREYWTPIRWLPGWPKARLACSAVLAAVASRRAPGRQRTPQGAGSARTASLQVTSRREINMGALALNVRTEYVGVRLGFWTHEQRPSFLAKNWTTSRRAHDGEPYGERACLGEYPREPACPLPHPGAQEMCWRGPYARRRWKEPAHACFAHDEAQAKRSWCVHPACTAHPDLVTAAGTAASCKAAGTAPTDAHVISPHSLARFWQASESDR